MSQNVWATIMPFGPVTNFLLAQKNFLGQPKAGHHFRHILTVLINSNGLPSEGFTIINCKISIYSLYSCIKDTH